MKQLTGFSIRAEERSFIINLRDDSGHAIEWEATPEQLDAMVDALEGLLPQDHEPLGPKAEPEIYQKPLG
jgi:hypothetical protein